MSNLQVSNFQGQSFHLVSPSLHSIITYLSILVFIIIGVYFLIKYISYSDDFEKVDEWQKKFEEQKASDKKWIDEVKKYTNRKIKDHNMVLGEHGSAKSSCKTCSQDLAPGVIKGCNYCGSLWHWTCEVNSPCTHAPSSSGGDKKTD